MNEILANNSQFIGSIGEKRVSAIFEKWHIATNKLSDNDFGEDYLCDIFSIPNSDLCIRTNLSFRLQVKATRSFSNSYIRKLKSGYYFSIDTTQLLYWQSLYYPVILCVWCVEEEKGYWCIPVEQIKGKKVSNQKSFSIKLYDNLEESEHSIKNYVTDYFGKIYKSSNAKYRCYAYPIWMPKYRLFTSFEIDSLLEKTDKNCFSFSPDELPSFLTSYNSLDLNTLNCICIQEEFNTLEDFVKNATDFLYNISYNKTTVGWISYVLSPIELICDDDRVINRFTDWQCLSVINKKIINDKEYVFDINEDFYKTFPIRSTSDDTDFLIHKSGRYAINILGTGFVLISRKTYNKNINKLLKNAYCVWDINNCTKKEITELYCWCQKNDLNICKTEYKNVLLISDSLLSYGSYGILIPGAVTWKDYDNGKVNELLPEVPCGKKANSQISQLIDRQLLNLNEYELATFDKTLYVNGEVLNIEDRIIFFTVYCYPKDRKKIEKCIRSLKELFKREFKNYYSEFNIYLEDRFSGISAFVLKIVPKIDYSSECIVDKISQFYEHCIDSIDPYVSIRKSMMEYITLYLQRRTIQ